MYNEVSREQLTNMTSSVRRVSQSSALTLVLALSACSSDTSSGGAGGTSFSSGGAQASSGGLTSAAGGALTTGGSSATAGGVSASNGGSATSGGSTANAGGAVATGGVANPSGGVSSAGSNSGGSNNGGSSSGGTANAGSSNGGSAGSSNGGSSSGGSNNGGSSSGGTTTAGASSGGSAGAPPTCTVARTGSATRPQLTDASAACFTLQRYFAQAGTIGALMTDNWNPSAGLPAASTFTPTFTVAKDGSGTHTSVQAAITAANATTGGARVFILVKPEKYREIVCVKGTVPITLYGADTDATKVTIAFNNYNAKTINPAETNPCALPAASATTYGTSGSTTFFVASNGFQAMNLTIANDYAEVSNDGAQAVALNTTGDQLVFQNLRVLGNQDTLMVKTPSLTTVARAYFKNSYIEGDTDFIFGRGTAVFDNCTITYVSPRKKDSTHISPSTEQAHPFGFLIMNSRILGDSGMPTGSAATAFLGRAWDDTSATAPNGQAIIRNTEIAAHIKVAAPWRASTEDRAFNAETNRFYEYKNTGAGAAP